MSPRIDATRYLSSGLGQAMLKLSAETQKNIDHRLFQLVEIRASQINGCAYCIDMHTKDACAAGETEQRIYALSAWRETPFFTDRERAALDWTETLTRIADAHPSDEQYQRLTTHFSEDEIVALTFAVVVINSWNRLAISFRAEVGSYQPRQLTATT
jgi:AhpD family alkylhydroperoxidase